MKKWILIICIFCVAGIYAAEREKEPVTKEFGYIDMGVGPLPILLPSFGTGYRFQNHHHGFDLNASVATVVEITALRGSVAYYFYPDPDPKSQFYYGLGATFGGIFGSGLFDADHVLFQPELVVGKEYQNEKGKTRFLQADINFPTVFLDGAETLYFPVVTLKYGIGF